MNPQEFLKTWKDISNDDRNATWLRTEPFMKQNFELINKSRLKQLTLILAENEALFLAVVIC